MPEFTFSFIIANLGKDMEYVDHLFDLIMLQMDVPLYVLYVHYMWDIVDIYVNMGKQLWQKDNIHIHTHIHYLKNFHVKWVKQRPKANTANPAVCVCF